jgi:hypothetical protein
LVPISNIIGRNLRMVETVVLLHLGDAIDYLCRVKHFQKSEEKKMKKVLIIALIMMVTATTGAFAFKGAGLAIGGEGALYYAGASALPAAGMITLHLPGIPFILGIGVAEPLALGFTADYWLGHGNIISLFDWYAGLGVYLAVDLSPNDVAFGIRIPIGIQVWAFGETLEIFLETAPAVGVSFIPTAFWWHIQAALGFRIWF